MHHDTKVGKQTSNALDNSDPLLHPNNNPHNHNFHNPERCFYPSYLQRMSRAQGSLLIVWQTVTKWKANTLLFSIGMLYSYFIC